MTIRCNITDADNRAFRRHILFRYRKIHWIYGGMLSLFLLLTWLGGKPEESVKDRILALLGGLILFGGAAVVFFLVVKLIGRMTRTGISGGTVGEHFFEFSDEGLSETNAAGTIITNLSAIHRMDETGNHFFLITGTGMGHVFPKRELPSLEVFRDLQLKIMASTNRVGRQ